MFHSAGERPSGKGSRRANIVAAGPMTQDPGMMTQQHYSSQASGVSQYPGDSFTQNGLTQAGLTQPDGFSQANIHFSWTRQACNSMQFCRLEGSNFESCSMESPA